MTGLRVLLLVGIAIGFGCGKDAKSPDDKASADAWFAAPMVNDVAQGEQKAGDGLVKEVQPRKIIYTAMLELIVDDLDTVEQELTQLVAKENGYVAKSELHGSPGTPRRGQWTVRIPVDHYGAFKDAAVKLGELRRATSDSDDITDKYFDLKAHLKNDQVEEEGLRKLLLEKSSGGKLEDILMVRRELRTVRGQIEQQQGQIQRWDKETAFATIMLNIHDRKDYVPPAAPGLRASIGRTFDGSVDGLATFGRWVILTVVALAPWLPVLALVAVPCWLWIRRVRAKAPIQ